MKILNKIIFIDKRVYWEDILIFRYFIYVNLSGK